MIYDQASLKYLISASACTGLNCSYVHVDKCSGSLGQNICTIIGSGSIALSVDTNSPRASLSIFPSDPTPTPLSR